MRQVLPIADGTEFTGTELTDTDLAALYAGNGCAERPFVRLNMAATLDGSATGSDGRSGTINTEPDHAIFGLLRAWSDVIVVGTGTIAAEGYDAPVTEDRWKFLRDGRPADPALAILTESGQVPPQVRTDVGGDVLAIRSSPQIGFDRIVDQLQEKGFRRVLCEGGPTIAGHALFGGAVDEFCLTWSPKVVVGDGPRTAHGAPIDRPAQLVSLLEENGTLIGRWQLR